MPRLNNFLYKHSFKEKIGVGYKNDTKRLLQVKRKEKIREESGRGAMVIYHQPPLFSLIFFSKWGAEIW